MSAYKPVNFIPDRLLDVLTEGERREMAGYSYNKPKEEDGGGVGDMA